MHVPCIAQRDKLSDDGLYSLRGFYGGAVFLVCEMCGVEMKEWEGGWCLTLYLGEEGERGGLVGVLRIKWRSEGGG